MENNLRATLSKKKNKMGFLPTYLFREAKYRQELDY